MPFSISVVFWVGVPSSSMVSEPRRLAKVPLSTMVHFSLATCSPILSVKTEVPLRLKSPSNPLALAMKS
jgi:hypothetical protein